LKHYVAESFNADLRENNENDGKECQDVYQKPGNVHPGINIDHGKATLVNYAD